MHVAPFDGAASEWDAFVQRQADGTHCHRHAWKPLIEEVFGHECRYLGARDETGELHGVLPLAHVRGRLFGHYLVSMPFLNAGGPLGDVEAVQALAGEAARLAEATDVDLLEMRSRNQLPLDLSVSHRKITVLLELPDGDPDVTWKALPAKVRSQVRRPQKEGMTARFGLDQTDPFFAVFARHMRDLGTPTLPLRFFRAIADRFADDARVACVYHRGRAVAAGFGFRSGDTVELTWASALREYARSAPNMLLYWSLIERCIDEGVRVFDFGRCTPGGGTHRFKLQWGGVDRQLHWYQGGRKGRLATPSPDQPGWALATRVWQRLPVSIATALGPRIVKYIP